jgi:predicted regulator of Ras-like GTPase activity (Roadblock/LC7/MglB family)
VPFQRILRELLTSTDGSLGAMFLDYEGETVACLTNAHLGDHDLKIIGAYQGIFLTQLRRLCAQMSVGEPQRFKIEFTESKILSCSLKDGYYVVLVCVPESNEGIAWHRLSRCATRLLEEM